jgi:hypothetical protein
MGDSTFEELKDRQIVEFEVVGSRFQQGDSTIAVLGKLKSVVENAPFKAERAEPEEPMLAAPTGQIQGSQKVVTVAPAAPTAAPRKRKLNPNAA